MHLQKGQKGTNGQYNVTVICQNPWHIRRILTELKWLSHSQYFRGLIQKIKISKTLKHEPKVNQHTIHAVQNKI